MINLKKQNNSFINYLINGSRDTEVFLPREADTKIKTVDKLNSLAYLAFQSRKKKGLIADNGECPTFYFGDEFPL